LAEAHRDGGIGNGAVDQMMRRCRFDRSARDGQEMLAKIRQE
jgi:hypothetical protein